MTAKRGRGLLALVHLKWIIKAMHGLIFDQRLFWVLCLMLLIVKGAGKFSLDYLLGIEKDSRQQG